MWLSGPSLFPWRLSFGTSRTIDSWQLLHTWWQKIKENRRAAWMKGRSSSTTQRVLNNSACAALTRPEGAAEAAANAALPKSKASWLPMSACSLALFLESCLKCLLRHRWGAGNARWPQRHLRELLAQQHIMTWLFIRVNYLVTQKNATIKPLPYLTTWLNDIVQHPLELQEWSRVISSGDQES